MQEPRKPTPIVDAAIISTPAVATPQQDTNPSKEPKPRVVVQTNLTPVRCGDCNALLAKGTIGSVLGIVCGRCKTYNFVEITRSLTDIVKKF